MVVLIRILRGDIPHAFAGDVDHSIGNAKGVLRVIGAVLFEISCKAAKVFAVEGVNDFGRDDCFVNNRRLVHFFIRTVVFGESSLDLGIFFASGRRIETRQRMEMNTHPQNQQATNYLNPFAQRFTEKAPQALAIVCHSLPLGD